MDRRFLLLQLCFFISGFAALLYETAWTRELASVFGTSELAVSAVLAAYMGGLALGAALVSRWAPRVRRPILAYGLLELGIAVGALWVPFGIRFLSGIYVSWLGGIEAAPAEVGLLSSLFHLGGTFLALLPCTTLMGATLPLLARHAIREEEEIGPRIGVLYAVNTGGAIAGALAAAFLLLPEYGLRQTIYFGAATNALVFLAAAALSRVSPPPVAPAPAEVSSSPRSPAAGGIILPLITLSGMVSFAYEVLWVRLLGFVLGGSTAAFASMLSSFLLGIALGSAAASRFARTPARAALGFSLAQLGTAFFATITFALADWIPVLAGELGAGVSNLAGGALISVAALLPTTLCIGATFPFAVRILARSAEDAAPAAARVYAWNTLGSILGSIAAGFFLLPALGFAGTLVIGVGVNLALAAAAVFFLSSGRPYRSLAWAALAGMILLGLVRPEQPLGLITRSTLSGQSFGGKLEFLAVGRSATVTVTRKPFSRRLATNGLPEASIESPFSPPDRFHESRWLSILPTLVRPATSRILVIGLGGGNTLGAVPSPVESIDLIELEPEVVEANRLIGADRLGGAPLADPRMNLRIGDARGALMLADRRYDAIISQPSHPWTSGASHLYTREFFGMVKERLEPGGVFVQWMGLGFVDDDLLRGLVGTLSDVFEHLVVLAPGGHLGSGAMLFLSSDAPLDLLENSASGLAVAREGFARVGAHKVEDIATSIVLENESARRFAGASPRITDDHNLLAWSASRIKQGRAKRESIASALGAHDELLTRTGELDTDLMVRGLLQKDAVARARALADSLSGAKRASARGWVALERSGPQEALRHFQDAAELDPNHRPGLLGLAMLEPGQTDLEDLEPREAGIIRAFEERKAQNWGELADYDEALADWEAGSLLYPEAARMRVGWRLATKDPQHARDALVLLDELIPRDKRIVILLLRTEAAALAGLDEYGWASLDRLLGKLQGSVPRAKVYALRALNISRQLESMAGARGIVRGLKLIAGPPDKSGPGGMR